MGSNQTEFEKYLVEADKQVKEYIDQEMWRFTKEQRPTWWYKPPMFPAYMQTIFFEDEYAAYRIFYDPENDVILEIMVGNDSEPYILCRAKIDGPPYHRNGSFPLVPGLLAVLVNYFLDAGYTPLVDAKENRNG